MQHIKKEVLITIEIIKINKNEIAEMLTTMLRNKSENECHIKRIVSVFITLLLCVLLNVINQKISSKLYDCVLFFRKMFYFLFINNHDSKNKKILAKKLYIVFNTIKKKLESNLSDNSNECSFKETNSDSECCEKSLNDCYFNHPYLKIILIIVTSLLSIKKQSIELVDIINMCNTDKNIINHVNFANTIVSLLYNQLLIFLKKYKNKYGKYLTCKTNYNNQNTNHTLSVPNISEETNGGATRITITIGDFSTNINYLAYTNVNDLNELNKIIHVNIENIDSIISIMNVNHKIIKNNL